MNYTDRVQDLTTSTGTGAFSLSGNPPAGGYQPISAIGAIGTTFIYGVSSGNLWEIGVGTITATNTVSRVPSSSSSGGAAVDFPAGAVFFCTLSAAQIAKFNSTNTAAFTTVIPLTSPGAVYLPQQAVASVLGFSIAAAPVQGALCYVRLAADGTNVPTYAGMKEWGGSSGYDNRNGIINEVQFFYDGYDYWYSISQAIGATAVDAIPPTASSAAVANSAPTIVSILMSEAMNGTYVPAASAFTIGGHAVSNVAISGSSINLTCSAAFVNGEAARTIAYTQTGTNNARDLAGNLLGNFTALAITNNVGAVATGVTMAGPTGGATSVASTNFTVGVTPVGSAITGTVIVTPSDGGGGGTFSPTSVNLTTGAPTATFTYTPSATAGARTISVTNNGSLTDPSNITYTSAAAVAPAAITFPTNVGLTTASGNYTGTGSTAGVYSSYGVSSKKLPAGVDGWIQYTNTNGGIVLLSLETSAANDPGTDTTGNIVEYGMLYAGGSLYKIENATLGASATSVVTEGNLSVYRINRTGTTVTIKKSPDNGVTFTTLYTFSAPSSTDLYPHLYIQQAGTCYAPTGMGLV